MERESRKRARDEGEDKKESSEMSNNTAKKQHLSNNSNSNNNNNNNNGMSLEEGSLSGNYLGLGVFDFPWLKEGMISKSEDWKFEDTFSSSLNSANGLEFYGQNLCRTPVPLVDFPDDDNGRFDHHAAVDGDDCIWSSLLNQPLEPGVFN